MSKLSPPKGLFCHIYERFTLAVNRSDKRTWQQIWRDTALRLFLLTRHHPYPTRHATLRSNAVPCHGFFLVRNFLFSTIRYFSEEPELEVSFVRNAHLFCAEELDS